MLQIRIRRHKGCGLHPSADTAKRNKLELSYGKTLMKSVKVNGFGKRREIVLEFFEEDIWR